jgi:hypothetical protein
MRIRMEWNGMEWNGMECNAMKTIVRIAHHERKKERQ